MYYRRSWKCKGERVMQEKIVRYFSTKNYKVDTKTTTLNMSKEALAIVKEVVRGLREKGVTITQGEVVNDLIVSYIGEEREIYQIDGEKYTIEGLCKIAMESRVMIEVGDYIENDSIRSRAEKFYQEVCNIAEELLTNTEQMMRDELTFELEDEVREELEEELRESLTEEIEDEVRATLEDEIRAELEDEVRETLKEEIEEELRATTEYWLKDEVRGELESEIRAELEDEIREELEEEVRETLREELEEEVRETLRFESFWMGEQEQEEWIENELDDRLEAEVENQLEGRLDDEVENELNDRVEEEVENRLDDEVENQLEYRLDDEIENELEERLGDRLEEEVEDELESRLEQELEEELETRLEEELEARLEEELENRVEEKLHERVDEQYTFEIDGVYPEIKKSIARLTDDICAEVYEVGIEYLKKESPEKALKIEQIVNYFIVTKDVNFMMDGLKAFIRYKNDGEIDNTQVNYILKVELNEDPKRYTFYQGVDCVKIHIENKKLISSPKFFLQMHKALGENMLEYTGGVSISREE